MGSVGEIILFQLLLVLQTFVGFVVLSYGAYVFLSIVQDTAAGNDEVVFVEEPAMDRFWKLVFLGWLTICSVVPAMILVSVLRGVLPKGNEVLQITIAAGWALWLLLPIFLLSSLTSGVWWYIVNRKIARWAAMRPGIVIRFYLLTALLAAGCIALFGLSATSKSGYVLLLFFGPVLSASFLIYARLIGRLAWALGRNKESDPRNTSNSTVVGKSNIAPKESPTSPRTQRDPAIERPRVASDEGNDQADETRPMRRRDKKIPSKESSRPDSVDERAKPYDVMREELLPLPEVTCSAEDETLSERRVLAPPPAHPLLDGVWLFPWYPSSLKAWLWLSLGFFLMVAALVYQLRLTGAIQV